MRTQERTQTSNGPLIWPILLVLVGGLLLLANFFLLGNFQLTQLWPLLLVLVGAQILLRGDAKLSEDTRTFGITRGSLESATLEINSGEVDVRIRALPPQSAERLIAGQYAPQARPALHAEDTHAHLTFQRGATPWFAQTDWELGLSGELPWQILLGSSLGAATIDLRQVITHEARISTGFGDIHCVAPAEAFQPLHLISTLGNITLEVPDDVAVIVHIQASRFSNIHVNNERFIEEETLTYHTTSLDGSAPIQIFIKTGFGNIHLV